MLKRKRFNVLLSCIIALSFLLVPSFAFAAADGLGPVTENAIPVIENAAPVTTNAIWLYGDVWRLSVTANGVRVRSQPNTSSTILGLLYQNNGDYVDVSQWAVPDSTGTYTWCYGRTSTGIYGWVYRGYLEDLPGE